MERPAGRTTWTRAAWSAGLAQVDAGRNDQRYLSRSQRPRQSKQSSRSWSAPAGDTASDDHGSRLPTYADLVGRNKPDSEIVRRSREYHTAYRPGAAGSAAIEERKRPKASPYHRVAWWSMRIIDAGVAEFRRRCLTPG
jgi:hypothetical protein